MTRLSIIMLIIFLLSWLSIVKALRKARNERKTQDALLRRYADKFAQGAWYRVRYASQTWFETSWKLTPWEKAGILWIGQDVLGFYSHDAKGDLDELQWRPDDITASWFGTRLWPNGRLQWFTLSAHGQTCYMTADTGSTVLRSLEMTQDILRRVQTWKGELGDIPQDSSTGQFSLEKNPFTLAVLLVAAAFGLYALVDIVANTEIYARTPFFRLYALVCGITALLTSAGLLRARIPKPESLGLGVVLGLALGLACYPGLLRLNQLTDAQGKHTYNYVLQEDLSLLPLEPHLPTLKFDEAREYWAHQEPGSLHAFLLRQGGLGFYQVEMAPIYAKTRKFYDTYQDGQ